MINKIKLKSKANILGLLFILLKYLFYKFILNKNILCGTNVRVKIHKSKFKGLLQIDLDNTNFTDNKSRTYINIRGELFVNGNFTIGRGNRFDIGPNATITLGDKSYINPNGLFVIMHHLKIGERCSISWNCHFLDESFHQLNYEGKTNNQLKGIVIGNEVWIGSNVILLGGVEIPNGCVVAANSCVNGVFKDENCLIAGNPAKVVKTNITWS